MPFAMHDARGSDPQMCQHEMANTNDNSRHQQVLPAEENHLDKVLFGLKLPSCHHRKNAPNPGNTIATTA
jgi:hypothetical protein